MCQEQPQTVGQEDHFPHPAHKVLKCLKTIQVTCLEMQFLVYNVLCRVIGLQVKNQDYLKQNVKKEKCPNSRLLVKKIFTLMWGLAVSGGGGVHKVQSCLWYPIELQMALSTYTNPCYSSAWGVVRGYLAYSHLQSQRGSEPISYSYISNWALHIPILLI